jgi:predicted anti-sigma-YlaC factor YlaD
LATRNAIAKIESFDGGDTAEVRRAIATALEAGDASREADMRISLHLESCAERIGSYEHILELLRRSHVLEAKAYMRKHRTAEPENEEQKRIAADYEEERTKVKEWLKPCAQHLHEDLGN